MGAVPARVHRFGRGAWAYGAHLTFSRQRISLVTTHGGPVIFACASHPGCDFLAHCDQRSHRCGRAVALAALWADLNFVIASVAKQSMDQASSKASLRRTLRKARREHATAQPDNIRALLFHRPPAPLLKRIGPDAIIGLYHASEHEAPTRSYAKFFHEAAHTIALPHFTDEQSPMAFRQHTDPFGESDLDRGPFGLSQPAASAPAIVPNVLFVPLIGFTTTGERLGQGGGHYDRWLAEHPDRMTIGLAWDVQLCETLPTEPHDIALDAIVTPTRIYGID